MNIFKKKKDIEITWNINYEMTKWINKYFKLYKDTASQNVDLTFHKFTFENKEYTQIEMIDKVIRLSEDLINDAFDLDKEEELDKKKNTLFKILSEIYWVMWW